MAAASQELSSDYDIKKLLINLILNSKSSIEFFLGISKIGDINMGAKTIKKFVDINSIINIKNYEWNVYAEFFVLQLLNELKTIDHYENVISPYKMIEEGYDLKKIHEDLSFEIDDDVKFKCSKSKGLISKIKIDETSVSEYFPFQNIEFKVLNLYCGTTMETGETKLINSIKYLKNEDFDEYTMIDAKSLHDIGIISVDEYDHIIVSIKEKNIGETININGYDFTIDQIEYMNSDMITKYMMKKVIPKVIFEKYKSKFEKHAKIYFHGIRLLKLTHGDIVITIDACANHGFEWWRFYIDNMKSSEYPEFPQMGYGITEECEGSSHGIYDTLHYDVFNFDFNKEMKSYYFKEKLDGFVFNLSDILKFFTEKFEGYSKIDLMLDV